MKVSWSKVAALLKSIYVENDIKQYGVCMEKGISLWLSADIDRGGVFAHLYMAPWLCYLNLNKPRVKGFVINRFRGDIALLQSGLDWLEEKTGKLCDWCVAIFAWWFQPWSGRCHHSAQESDGVVKLKVVVPVLTRISNHTDFDALRLNPSIDLRYVGKGERANNVDLIILPGTKSVIYDLIT